MGREKRKVEYKVRVHTLPEDLRPPLSAKWAHLSDTSAVYQRAIDSNLLWCVWMIDEFGSVWIAVEFVNEGEEPEFHTLRLDPGTYREVLCDPYETIVEQP
jgi:hypothetical protein